MGIKTVLAAETLEGIAANEQALGLAEKAVNLYNVALGLGTILALGIIIYAGVRYTASGGNASAIGDAKKWISAALFGLVLLFSTVLILNVINPNLRNLDDSFLGELDQIEPDDSRISIPEPNPDGSGGSFTGSNSGGSPSSCEECLKVAPASQCVFFCSGSDNSGSSISECEQDCQDEGGSYQLCADQCTGSTDSSGGGSGGGGGAF